MKFFFLFFVAFWYKFLYICKVNIQRIKFSMKHIYFFRHGESTLNVKNVLQGHVHKPPLTEKGREQAKVIAQKLKNAQLEIMYTSPQTRARQTAEIVNAFFRVPLLRDNKLKEMNLGDLDGLTMTEATEKYPEIIHAFLNSENIDLSLRCPNGESFEELTKRAKTLFEEFVEISTFQSVAVSSHGMFLKYALYGLGFKMDMPPSNAQVGHLVYNDGEWTFLGFI